MENQFYPPWGMPAEVPLTPPGQTGCCQCLNSPEPAFAYGPNPGTAAYAYLRGGPQLPQLCGSVSFLDIPGGTWVCVQVSGLPPYQPAADGRPPIGPHGFHIHAIGDCTVGDPANPFVSTDGHWNPTNQPHGNHAGDFPVLFSNRGYAAMCFFTDKFKPVDVVGRAVIIHENPDDYRTQPAGASGRFIACGVIQGG